MSIGSYLKQRREKTHKTMAEIADKLKLSVSYVSQLESGVRLPSPKQFAMLAKAYGVKEEELKDHWFDTKMSNVVGVATKLNFKIEEAVQRKATEMMEPIKKELDQTKAKLKCVVEIPILPTVPVKEVIGFMNKAKEFIYLPESVVPKNHQLFALKITVMKMPGENILSGDYVIFDYSTKPKIGDIVLLSASDGVGLSYYVPRSGYLHIPSEGSGKGKVVKAKAHKESDVLVLGKVIMHLKNFKPV
jgi:transcriptional regulator with XRE-family HTH domain